MPGRRYAVSLAAAFMFLLALALPLAAGADGTSSAPLAIVSARVVSVTAQTATVNWQTNLPATDQVAYGLDRPVIWTPVSTAPETTHTVTIRGLNWSRGYNLSLLSATSDGQVARATLQMTTPPLGATTASTQNGVIYVNGSPVLPLTAFAACQDSFPSLLAAGITMVMEDQCGEKQFDELAGQMLTVGDVMNRGYDGNGFIGWFYPDEWDLQLPAGTTWNDLQPKLPPFSQTGRISFLTLSNHVYAGSAQLPGKQSLYPLLERLPDVLGVDLYPITSWCTKSKLAGDTSVQQQLAATGKPTYQWIESRAMDCGNAPAVTPTPATVQAEAWLSLIGGAHMLGYFPHDWSTAIGQQLATQNREIVSLAPALEQPVQRVTVKPDASPLKQTPVVAGAWTLNGAIYIAAVNTSASAQSVAFTVSGLHGQPLFTYRGSEQITPVLNGFSDTLPGYGVQLYIAAPDGSS